MFLGTHGDFFQFFWFQRAPALDAKLYDFSPFYQRPRASSFKWGFSEQSRLGRVEDFYQFKPVVRLIFRNCPKGGTDFFQGGAEFLFTKKIFAKEEKDETMNILVVEK